MENVMIMEKIAFYDALASHDTAEQVLGDDTLKIIAHEFIQSIKANMSIDWNLHESARANMPVIVRCLLKNTAIHQKSVNKQSKPSLNKQN